VRVAPWPKSRSWTKILGIFGAFSVLGLLFSSQVWVDYAYSGQRVTWALALAIALIQWYLWALLTPILQRLAHRFRLQRGRWGIALLVHGILSVVIGVAMIVVQESVARALSGVPRGPFSLLRVYMSILTYWAIVVVSYTVEYYNSARDREVRAAQLEGALAAAELQSLRLQLHPHFLFNTLNAIGALMHENVETADLMLTRLSDLLRSTLETSNLHQIALRRELELLEPYLDIQKTRIGERLTLQINVDPKALDVLVPTLLLQPLVENAIKHGIADRSGAGLVVLEAHVRRGTLTVFVRDDGPGPAALQNGSGYGLENVRRRLHALHGARASLVLERAEAGGAIARVELPAS
jgi:two-component system, LytTR family, sensor kinase